VWRQTQRAFGQMAIDPASTIENNLRFAGQYFDEETGTHYNYFRDYEPGLGRYLQQDPIGLGGGVNVYGYVDGRPKNLIDPLGLQAYMCRNAGIEAWCDEPKETCCDGIEECFDGNDAVGLAHDCLQCAITRNKRVCTLCGASGGKGATCILKKCKKVPKGTCGSKSPQPPPTPSTNPKDSVLPVSIVFPYPDELPTKPETLPICMGS